MKKSVTVTAILAVTAMLCLACGSTTPIGPTDGGSGNCGAMTCASGQSCIENKVCVTTPTTEAEAFIPKAWPPAETKLDLSCFSTAPQPSAGPVLVSVHACLSTFGISLPTEDLEISYYDYAGGKIGSQIGVTVTAVKAVSRTCPNTGYYEIDNIPTNKLLVRKVACAADDATCKT
jgi:hypothetical protein